MRYGVSYSMSIRCFVIFSVFVSVVYPPTFDRVGTVAALILVALRPLSSVSMDIQKQMCNVYRGDWLDGMRHGQVREYYNVAETKARNRIFL